MKKISNVKWNETSVWKWYSMWNVGMKGHHETDVRFTMVWNVRMKMIIDVKWVHETSTWKWFSMRNGTKIPHENNIRCEMWAWNVRMKRIFDEKCARNVRMIRIFNVKWNENSAWKLYSMRNGMRRPLKNDIRNTTAWSFCMTLIFDAQMACNDLLKMIFDSQWH